MLIDAIIYHVEFIKQKITGIDLLSLRKNVSLKPKNQILLKTKDRFNYNSYSYCLNNPLKYADPSGNVFVLDDFIAITAMGAMMGAMNVAMSDKPIWKGALLGAASAAATYGIGSIFNGVGTFGHELLRAGAHGLSSGVQKVGEW